MPGRKPKPTKQKILQGTFRKDRSNPAEPNYQKGLAPPPEWLNEDGLKVWRELAPPLIEAGVLLAPDHAMWSVYCQLLGEFIEAAREGRVISAARTSQIRSLASVFGLEPSSRSKIQVTAQPQKSEWDDI